jgi:hypothetical protein
MVDPTKRWRAWLRAVHRDVGYLAIGFTVIYAVSGIAQNHIEDWGDVSYQATERTLTIPAIADTVPDELAVKAVAEAAGLGAPRASTRTGDELRLDYGEGVKVTAIGRTVTVQTRTRRAFIGVANWLHTARGKPAWKYLSDAFAILLLYLAVSGALMIKGRLGLKWRGTMLIAVGVAVPALYVALSGGPNAQQADPAIARAGPVPPQAPAAPAQAAPSASPPSAPTTDANPAGSAVLVPLAPGE